MPLLCARVYAKRLPQPLTKPSRLTLWDKYKHYLALKKERKKWRHRGVKNKLRE